MKKIAKKIIKKTDKELSVQELLKLHNTDMKRYVGSLSEDFQGRVSAIGEQFSGLNRRLDTHDKQFEKIDEQFKKIDEQFKIVHLSLGSMKEDLEVMKEDLTIIKADVKKRVTYDEFTALTKRVLLLEKKAHR